MPAHLHIRRRRLELELTQQRLVDALRQYGLYDFDVPKLSKLETGKRLIPVDELLVFAAALKCGPSDLLDPPTARITLDKSSVEYIHSLCDRYRKWMPRRTSDSQVANQTERSTSST